MRNPMNKRLPRELKSDFGKYLVIFLFIVMVVSVVSSFLVANAGIAKSYKKNLKNTIKVYQGEKLLKDIHAEEKASGKIWNVDKMQIGKHVKAKPEKAVVK